MQLNKITTITHEYWSNRVRIIDRNKNPTRNMRLWRATWIDEVIHGTKWKSIDFSLFKKCRANACAMLFQWKSNWPRPSKGCCIPLLIAQRRTTSLVQHVNHKRTHAHIHTATSGRPRIPYQRTQCSIPLFLARCMCICVCKQTVGMYDVEHNGVRSQEANSHNSRLHWSKTVFGI